MRFDELNELIPHALGKKEKVLTYSPYADVTIAMPGRHQKETTPPGGDFVVMVSDDRLKWSGHQFKHSHIFNDLELKSANKDLATEFMESYLAVIGGDDPQLHVFTKFDALGGMRPSTFLRASQLLAIAEHRRYARHEAKFGGRFLPFRFGAGIVEGLWTAAEASDKQKYGRPAVERLEQERGTPVLTKGLMK